MLPGWLAARRKRPIAPSNRERNRAEHMAHVVTTCGEDAKSAWSGKARYVDATLRSVCAYEDHASKPAYGHGGLQTAALRWPGAGIQIEANYGL